MVTTYIFFLVAAVCVTAGQVGVLLPQDFGKRSIPQNGGWSLQAITCPSGTSDCGAAWCCPNSLTCVHTGDSDNAEACCPTGKMAPLLQTGPLIQKLTADIDSPCQTSLQAAPVCADSSWNLWNTTNGAGPAYDGYTGYVCCLPGQISSPGEIETVGQNAICIDADTPGVGTLVSWCFYICSKTGPVPGQNFRD